MCVFILDSRIAHGYIYIDRYSRDKKVRVPGQFKRQCNAGEENRNADHQTKN